MMCLTMVLMTLPLALLRLVLPMKLLLILKLPQARMPLFQNRMALLLPPQMLFLVLPTPRKTLQI